MSTQATLPSGTQWTLSGHGYDAVVTECGAGLRTLSASGAEIVGGFGPDEMAPAGRGQLLLPWPNRIDGGTYQFGGAMHELPISELTAANAIHGLTRWLAWSGEQPARDRVVLRQRLLPQPGYPFALALRATYALGPGGLGVEISGTNIGREPAPYGAGVHPYLTAGTPLIDEAELTIPATTAWACDERGLPTHSLAVDGTELDFRDGRLVGTTKLDTPFTDLLRDSDGMARAVLRSATRSVTLWMDGSCRWLQAFSGDNLARQARKAIALEPMTCPPNAFVSGLDLAVLEPGKEHIMRWGISAG
jgi:aldose 1-epimerase